MMRPTIPAILLGAAILAGACASKQPSDPPPSDPSPPAAAPATAAPIEVSNGLTRVTDVSLVCMVNNTYMGRAQIPVEVDGKTYFGCCPACKERLAKEPDARFGVDPVSGEKVDKASAVIGQDGTGAVLYFASEQNMRRYRAP